MPVAIEEMVCVCVAARLQGADWVQSCPRLASPIIHWCCRVRIILCCYVLQQLLATITHLSDVLHQHYPAVVPLSFVWGYGRALWDTGCRLPGQKQLKVILLGPAASGKSTQAELLADRYEGQLTCSCINSGCRTGCQL